MFWSVLISLYYDYNIMLCYLYSFSSFCLLLDLCLMRMYIFALDNNPLPSSWMYFDLLFMF